MSEKLTAMSGAEKNGKGAEDEGENGWKAVGTIHYDEASRMRNLYAARGKEVKFESARNSKGYPIEDHLTVLIRDMVIETLDPDMERILNQLLNIEPATLIERYNDPEAQFYRGTILGFVLVALRKNEGLLLSPDPDREGFLPMATTVVSPRIETAEFYAQHHGVGTETVEHDIFPLAAQLGIDMERLQREYPSLLYPVVLHIKDIHATENPEYMNEYHTAFAVSLFRNLTSECKKRIEAALGMEMGKIAQYPNERSIYTVRS